MSCSKYLKIFCYFCQNTSKLLQNCSIFYRKAKLKTTKLIWMNKFQLLTLSTIEALDVIAKHPITFPTCQFTTEIQRSRRLWGIPLKTKTNKTVPAWKNPVVFFYLQVTTILLLIYVSGPVLGWEILVGDYG